MFSHSKRSAARAPDHEEEDDHLREEVQPLLGDACFVFGRVLGRVLLSEKVTR